MTGPSVPDWLNQRQTTRDGSGLISSVRGVSELEEPFVADCGTTWGQTESLLHVRAAFGSTHPSARPTIQCLQAQRQPFASGAEPNAEPSRLRPAVYPQLGPPSSHFRSRALRRARPAPTLLRADDADRLVQIRVVPLVQRPAPGEREPIHRPLDDRAVGSGRRGLGSVWRSWVAWSRTLPAAERGRQRHRKDEGEGRPRRPAPRLGHVARRAMSRHFTALSSASKPLPAVSLWCFTGPTPRQ